MLKGLTIRNGRAEDLDALGKLRYSKTIHVERLRDAEQEDVRYLAAEYKGQVVGFGVLVFSQPPNWPAVGKLPQMLDLFIGKESRGRGIGTSLIQTMERATAKQGYSEIFATVEPTRNPTAYNLYLRLGYRPLQTKPRENYWRFTDSEGKSHEGVEWIVDMRRPLSRQS